jgi:hypothetical protein
MVICIDEATGKHERVGRNFSDVCSETVIRFLERTARWPVENPREPVCIDTNQRFRKCSPPPAPREFRMDLDSAC